MITDWIGFHSILLPLLIRDTRYAFGLYLCLLMIIIIIIVIIIIIIIIIIAIKNKL